MTTEFYKQKYNECAAAAVFMAVGESLFGEISPIDLGDSAAAIDALDGRNIKEGGTQISVCLYLLRKYGRISEYLNIGARWSLLNEYLDKGGRAVISIPSQATLNGRELRHAVTIIGRDKTENYYVYDPAKGTVEPHPAHIIQAKILKNTLMPQVYIMDSEASGKSITVVKDIKTKEKIKNVLFFSGVLSVIGLTLWFFVL
jgi:hypothetical protein